MPFISIKAWPGRTEETKREVAEKIALAASEIMKVPLEKFTVGFEDVPEERWETDVVKPLVIAKEKTIYIKAGKKT
ncbi:MAG: tautomerase family protein [Treponemataceae bacterium]